MAAATSASVRPPSGPMVRWVEVGCGKIEVAKRQAAGMGE